MKTIRITCDKCGTCITGQHICIGSMDEQSFKYKSTVFREMNGRGVINMEKVNDLHFCSKKCFIDYFF